MDLLKGKSLKIEKYLKSKESVFKEENNVNLDIDDKMDFPELSKKKKEDENINIPV